MSASARMETFQAISFQKLKQHLGKEDVKQRKGMKLRERRQVYALLFHACKLRSIDLIYTLQRKSEGTSASEENEELNCLAVRVYFVCCIEGDMVFKPQNGLYGSN